MRTAFPNGVITEKQLRRIPLRAEPTDTWEPVRHADALDLVLDGLSRNGLEIADSDDARLFTTVADGHRVFGTFRLRSNINDDVALLLGFANSTDRSVALKLGFGSHVFVCSNGCFFAERVVGRKHTSRILMDIADKIDEALAGTSAYLEQQASFFDGLRDVRLQPAQVNDIVVRSCIKDDIISKGQIVDVVREFHEPSFDAFADPNAWSLHNAYTEIMKRQQRSNGVNHADKTLALTRFLQKEFKHELDYMAQMN